jgi:hypothetical protein
LKKTGKIRKTKAEKRKLRMREWFKKTFRAANRNIRAIEIIRVRDGDTIRANRQLGPEAHRALREITKAILLLGAQATPRMRFDDIPKGTANNWSDYDKMVWHSVWLWDDLMGASDERGGNARSRKAHQAVLLFADPRNAMGPRDIERKVKSRNGTFKQMLIEGVMCYLEINRDAMQRREYILRKMKD